jgi:hypothetical protein
MGCGSAVVGDGVETTRDEPVQFGATTSFTDFALAALAAPKATES